MVVRQRHAFPGFAYTRRPCYRRSCAEDLLEDEPLWVRQLSFVSHSLLTIKQIALYCGGDVCVAYAVGVLELRKSDPTDGLLLVYKFGVCAVCDPYGDRALTP